MRLFTEERVIMKKFKLFCRDEKGGGLVEYVLIITLIALGAVAGMTVVGTKLNTSMTSISATL
jgi:Flp pilus assembly pilin Flp